VSEITTKAEGVFLWVYLVVIELSKSFTNLDDYATLQRRLQRLPPGLEPYFRYMFDNLDRFYQHESAQIFRAAVASPFELPLLSLAAIFRTEPLAAPLLGDMTDELIMERKTNLTSILAARTRGCCGDLMEVGGHRIQFLHRTVRDFLANDDMIIELETRAGTEFNIDTTMCRISLIGLYYYPDYFDGMSSSRAKSSLYVHGDDEKFTAWQFLFTFYTHARNLEDRSDHSPIDLHEALKNAASMTDGLSLYRRCDFEAFMQAKLQLNCSIQAAEISAINCLWLTDCAVNALGYLLWPSGASGIRLPAFYSHKKVNCSNLAEYAFEMDPDRREFKLDILTLLLEHGADPHRLWPWALRAFFNERKSCSDSRRAMFFKVSAALIKAGAQEVSLNSEEDETLENLFGKLDARWLCSLRESSAKKPPIQHRASNEFLNEIPDATPNTPSNETSHETSKGRTTALTSIFSWFTGR
jgi:hypothetical protein